MVLKVNICVANKGIKCKSDEQIFGGVLTIVIVLKLFSIASRSCKNFELFQHFGNN